MAAHDGTGSAPQGTAGRWTARQFGSVAAVEAGPGHLRIRTRGPLLLGTPFLLFLGLGVQALLAADAGDADMRRVGLILCGLALAGLAAVWSTFGPRTLELDRPADRVTLLRPPWPARSWPMAAVRDARWRSTFRAGWLLVLDDRGRSHRASTWLDGTRTSDVARRAAEAARALLEVG